jgi:PAS domain S-box-containing protein
MATILIVEDRSTNRAFLSDLLRKHGHRVLEATNARAGFAAVRDEHPDLLITDVLMPEVDGYEFVRQLRLDPATCAVPVVFYTATYGEREAKALALSIGVSYVLAKPAAPEDVLRIVEHVLSGESETGILSGDAPLTATFDRDHLRLLTDTLSEKNSDLRTANARLRALINIGLELASERNADRLLERVCVAARELFGATYVTLGILDLEHRTVQHLVTSGVPAADWIAIGDSISGILGTVVAERRTVRGDNPGGHPDRLPPPARRPGIQTFLAAPVASPARVHGWICLVGNEGRTFTQEDEDLVTALSGQVGRIYENSYFSAAAQQRAEELEREMLVRREAESALRLERDRAQRYLDTAEVILLALDLDGRITLINRAGCALLGWTERELLGRDWIDTCLPPRIRDACRPLLGTLIADSLPVDENPVITRSGEERLIEWRNTVLRNDAGQVVGTLSSGTDVTQRHLAIKSLRTAEERMRFALEAAAVGIWDMDYGTGALTWSVILESQYGLQPGSFRGTFEGFLALVHPQDRDALRATMQEATRTGADFSVRHRTIWPDGTLHWLSGAGRIRLGSRGEPLRGVGISLDVTAHHELEEQYRQAQKIECIGRLAGGVAHDFNNLLTVILGFCEILLADLEQGDARRSDITEIQEAGRRAARLTRQLLAFSRKEMIEPTLLDVHAVVAGMQPMLARLIGEDVRIVLGSRPVRSLVLADRGQVEQVVMNLVVNARDAMPRGGTLTIETSCVELDERDAAACIAGKPGPYVVLTVSDTGTGIPPEMQARLFEPFFTTKEPGKGTGLGLATVHSIVTSSGGGVSVESEPGHGSSFKVYFPRADALEMPADVPPPIPRVGAGVQTILVVDDAEGLRELVKRLLDRLGYTVLLAANADQALELVERHPSIDLLLTDVVMPGASGPDLTRRLAQQRPGLKVIYMSGYTEEAIIRHGIPSPGITFLHKPFTSETLGRKIHEALG